MNRMVATGGGTLMGNQGGTLQGPWMNSTRVRAGPYGRPGRGGQWAAREKPNGAQGGGPLWWTREEPYEGQGRTLRCPGRDHMEGLLYYSGFYYVLTFVIVLIQVLLIYCS